MKTEKYGVFFYSKNDEILDKYYFTIENDAIEFAKKADFNFEGDGYLEVWEEDKNNFFANCGEPIFTKSFKKAKWEIWIFDESSNWDDEIAKLNPKGIYLVNVNDKKFICSLKASYEGYFLGTIYDRMDDEEKDEEIYNEILDANSKCDLIAYFDDNALEKIKLEDLDGFSFEDALDEVQRNHPY